MEMKRKQELTRLQKIKKIISKTFKILFKFTLLLIFTASLFTGFYVLKTVNDSPKITESLLNGYVHYVLRIDGKGNMSYYTYNDTGEAVMINQKIREYMKTNNILKFFYYVKSILIKYWKKLCFYKYIKLHEINYLMGCNQAP